MAVQRLRSLVYTPAHRPNPGPGFHSVPRLRHRHSLAHRCGRHLERLPPHARPPVWTVLAYRRPQHPGPENRVYDQIFIDGTHTDAGCLLAAASRGHVIAWHWAKRESAHAYTQLLSGIAEPVCVVLDGGQGALSAIKACWPNTLIQRCLVHAQRVIRRYTTSRPRTDAGKAIYALALKLTKITTLDQARKWTLRLHDFGVVYRAFLNEKPPVPKGRRTLTRQWEWMRIRVRHQAHSNLTGG